MNHHASVKKKLSKLREWMAKHHFDGVLLRKTRSFSWLTDGKAHHIVLNTDRGVTDLLITENQAWCVTSEMEADRIAEEELAGLGFDMIRTSWTEGTETKLRLLLDGKRIAADVYPEELGIGHVIYRGQELAELSYVLTEEEIIRYRQLCQASACAVESTCREMEPGMTEYEIQAMLAQKLLTQGIRPIVMLVATDDRIFRYRHPLPTGKKLERYAMVVVCAEQGGLVANVTRLVHFGSLPQELKAKRLQLAEIDAAFHLATRPGVKIGDVFQAGIKAYREAGYPEDWRYLHQGGPTGYATREFLATPESEGVVQLHQAFAWNPSIQGLKSEDTILVREDRNEILTETGEWPYIIMKKANRELKRPDILIRSS